MTHRLTIDAYTPNANLQFAVEYVYFSGESEASGRGRGSARTAHLREEAGTVSRNELLHASQECSAEALQGRFGTSRTATRTPTRVTITRLMWENSQQTIKSNNSHLSNSTSEIIFFRNYFNFRSIHIIFYLLMFVRLNGAGNKMQSFIWCPSNISYPKYVEIDSDKMTFASWSYS